MDDTVHKTTVLSKRIRARARQPPQFDGKQQDQDERQPKIPDAA